MPLPTHVYHTSRQVFARISGSTDPQRLYKIQRFFKSAWQAVAYAASPAEAQLKNDEVFNLMQLEIANTTLVVMEEVG